MSGKEVDLGAIRGDWDFHARYLTSAFEQTLKRTMKSWRALKAKAPADGQVPMSGDQMDEFIEACRASRALTDDIYILQKTSPKRRAARPKAKKKARRRAR